jgi:hypothetical protein
MQTTGALMKLFTIHALPVLVLSSLSTAFAGGIDGGVIRYMNAQADVAKINVAPISATSRDQYGRIYGSEYQNSQEFHDFLKAIRNKSDAQLSRHIFFKNSEFALKCGIALTGSMVTGLVEGLPIANLISTGVVSGSVKNSYTDAKRELEIFSRNQQSSGEEFAAGILGSVIAGSTAATFELIATWDFGKAGNKFRRYQPATELARERLMNADDSACEKADIDLFALKEERSIREAKRALVNSRAMIQSRVTPKGQDTSFEKIDQLRQEAMVARAKVMEDPNREIRQLQQLNQDVAAMREAQARGMDAGGAPGVIPSN